MMRSVFYGGLAALIALPAGLALAASQDGIYAGKTKAEVAQNLERKGYKVRNVEKVDGRLEVRAILEGRLYELFVDRETGKVVRKEQDPVSAAFDRTMGWL